MACRIVFSADVSAYRIRGHVAVNGHNFHPALGSRVNAKSLLGVLSLGIVKGTTITLIADGADEKEAVEALVELVKDNFGE